jgi:hypothetical protein
VSYENREALADWLLVLGAILLFGSLFLTWSHQLQKPLLVLFGTSDTLHGVPRDPTAWQVYSAADVVLALFAVALAAVAVAGSRGMRMAAFAGAFAALVFVIHAIASPPMSGVSNLFSPSNNVPQYYPLAPGAGVGETVALVAVLLAICGLGLSFTSAAEVTASRSADAELPAATAPPA